MFRQLFDGFGIDQQQRVVILAEGRGGVMVQNPAHVMYGDLTLA